jgi:hypothetical protein
VRGTLGSTGRRGSSCVSFGFVDVAHFADFFSSSPAPDCPTQFSHFAEKHKPPQSFKGEWIYPTVDVKTLGPTRPRYPWETDSDDGNV